MLYVRTSNFQSVLASLCRSISLCYLLDPNSDGTGRDLSGYGNPALDFTSDFVGKKENRPTPSAVDLNIIDYLAKVKHNFRLLFSLKGSNSIYRMVSIQTQADFHSTI